MATARTSVRGLEWFNFFIANVQTGFGPFISAYLTAHAWPQVQIGLVLTISGIVSLVGQLPAGIVVDAMRSKRLAASVAVVAIAGCALALGAWPIFPMVLLAEVLHGIASCLIGPAIAAMTIGLMDRKLLSRQFGRNASFASVGAGIAAAAMGACGTLLSYRSLFVLTALLALPSIWALYQIRESDIDPARHRGETEEKDGRSFKPIVNALKDRRLLIFASCLLLFHLANAAMLPLIASIVTMHANQRAATLIAACIVVPQIVVALTSPWVGRMSEQWGRKPLLLAGFAMLPIRGILFSIIGSPYLLLATQVLDGVSAAAIGVLLPLVVADITGRTGHFNAALGAVGTAAGIGASVSSTLAGYTIDTYGGSSAFLLLAGIGALGTIAVAVVMPDTRVVTPAPALVSQGGSRGR